MQKLVEFVKLLGQILLILLLGLLGLRVQFSLFSDQLILHLHVLFQLFLPNRRIYWKDVHRERLLFISLLLPVHTGLLSMVLFQLCLEESAILGVIRRVLETKLFHVDENSQKALRLS